jgi:hypothetical protein
MGPGKRNAEEVGVKLRAARQARGWSLRAAAARLGLSLRFLGELERGKATARLDKVMQALEGLGLDLEVVERHESGMRERVKAQKPLLRAIAAAHGVRSLSLFGSVARGDARPGSDLDFLIDLEGGRSLVDLVGVKHDLESLFGRPVDVFTRRSLKPAVLAAARADLIRVL